MFTFGCGGYGQLGHNSNNDEYNPRKVQVTNCLGNDGNKF